MRKRFPGILFGMVLALTLVLTLVFFAGITAQAETTTVTWDTDDGQNYLRSVEAYRDIGTDSPVIQSGGYYGIRVNYSGGNTNYKTGLYQSGSTTNVQFAGTDCELSFSSEDFLMGQVVIHYRNRPATNDISDDGVYINHGRWTKSEQVQNDEYYLTLTGPASDNVTFTYDRNAQTWSMEDIVSITFTSAEGYEYTAEKGITAGLARDGGLEFTSSAPFMVKRDGAIYGLPNESEGTYTYWADPDFQLDAENFTDNTLTIDSVASFQMALEKSYIHKIVLGTNLTLADGFTVPTNKVIDLNGKAISCTGVDKAINVSHCDATFSDSVGGGSVTGFTGIHEYDNGNININGGRFDFPSGINCHSAEHRASVAVGFFKLYDTFTKDDLFGYTTYTAAIRVGDDGWAEVYYHNHSVHTTLNESVEGSIALEEYCKICGRRINSTSISKAHFDRLIELNGGAFTPSWAWDASDPGHARLTLTVTLDTYRAALDEGMDYNAIPWYLHEPGIPLKADDVAHTELCGEYRTSVTFYGHTYDKTFNDPSDTHQIETVFNWDHNEETNEVTIKDAYRYCTKCGYRWNPSERYVHSSHYDATYKQ